MAELKVGDPAPEFRLKADDGREVIARGLRGKRVVLYFFPKVLTPGCSTEAAEFRDAKPEFDKLESGRVRLQRRSQWKGKKNSKRNLN